MTKKVLFLAAPFPIEIRTLSRIISLKYADFLMFMGSVVWGGKEDESERVYKC